MYLKVYELAYQIKNELGGDTYTYSTKAYSKKEALENFYDYAQDYVDRAAEDEIEASIDDFIIVEKLHRI